MGFFSKFFGDEELGNIDARIDNLMNNLSGSVRSTTEDGISGDFINEFINTVPEGEIGGLLQNVSVSRERLERYNVYDEAYKYVPIIKRIMTVYISNILQKNPVNGKCLFIRHAHDVSTESDNEKTIIDSAKQLADKCIDSFDLILKLRKKILPNMLLYGDCYVEIVNLVDEGKKKVDSSISSLPLFEAEISNIDKNITQMKLKREHNGTKSIQNDQIDRMLSTISEYFIEYQTDANEIANKSNVSKNNKEEVNNLDNILLKIHKPHKVIALETDFGSLLGYLILTKDEIPQTLNLTQSLSTLVGRITTLHGLDQKSESTIVDRLVRYMLKTVLDKTKKSGKLNQATNIDELLSGLSPDVFYYMKRLFVEQGFASKNTMYNRMRARFVPTSDMIAFSIPSAEYDPYGQSFVDSLVFPCKLYILSQLSNIIIKLSRAAPVRKWSLDIGQTQMQAGMIQKLKRELYNTRITLDDLSSFKSIPKILSDFKDDQYCLAY